MRTASLSVASSAVCGIAKVVIYKSIVVPEVMPSGVVELDAINVNAAPSHLYNSM